MSRDNVLRVEKNSNYKTISLFAVNDDNELSWRAVGIHTYLISKPSGWKFYKSDIISRHNEQRTAVNSALEELKENGYLSVEKEQDDDGKFVWKWVVHEVPSEHAQSTHNTLSGSGQTGNGQSSPTNKDNTNKEVSKPNSGNSGNEDVDWENLSRSQRLAQSSPASPCPEIEEVFGFCVEFRADVLNKQGGRPLKLTDKRHRQIKARLNEFSVDELKKSYKSMLHNDYHIQEGYDFPETCFKNDSAVDRHLDKYEERVNKEDRGNGLEHWG